jgi:hypothetical protein
MRAPSDMIDLDWLRFLRGYLVVVAVGHLVWETLQLPLYTIWSEGTLREQAVAVFHCTAGDVSIAGASLLGALVALGQPGWPQVGFRPVASLTIALGLGYTIYSEWSNVSRGSWTYSLLMPVVPGLGTGLSPLLQWIAVPMMGLWLPRWLASPSGTVTLPGVRR